MRTGLGPRFLIEAAFIVAVAAVAGVERFATATIVVSMLAAWLVVVALELGIWLSSRARARTRPMAAPEAEGEAATEARAEPASVGETTTPSAAEPAAIGEVTAPPPLEAVAPVQEREPEPSPEPEVTPGPKPAPTPEPVTSPEPDAPVAPERPSEPVPSAPRIAAVTSGPAEPPFDSQPDSQPLPQPDSHPPLQPEAQPLPQVVPLGVRRNSAPREWNLWDLERLARERSGLDAARDEERSYLLMYLREFANADGILPTDFDGVVRESFGDVLDAAYS